METKVTKKEQDTYMNDFEDWQPFFQGLWDSSLGNWTYEKRKYFLMIQYN